MANAACEAPKKEGHVADDPVVSPKRRQVPLKEVESLLSVAVLEDRHSRWEGHIPDYPQVEACGRDRDECRRNLRENLMYFLERHQPRVI